MKKAKPTKGGARTGAGRPISNPTKTITVRVPVDRYEELKQRILALIKAE